MHALDLWLKFIDTEERMPLFDEEPKEYSIPSLATLDLASEPEYITRIANEDMAILNDIESLDDLSRLFRRLREGNAKGLLFRSITHLLGEIRKPGSTTLAPTAILEAIFMSLDNNPFLSASFSQIGSWHELPEELAAKIENRSSEILRGLILSANDTQELVLEPMKMTLSQIDSMSSTTFAELIELVALTVRSPSLALDILLECFEPESTRLLCGIDGLMVNNFKRNLIGIALDHIGEVDEDAKAREDLLELKLDPKDIDGNSVVEATFRIDSPGGTPERSAHVRLTVASQPKNIPLIKPYSMDALVVSSEKGMAKFRCLHPLPPYFQQCSWRLTYCAPFVTTKAMFDAVKDFASNPEMCCSIWMQVLGAPSLSPKLAPIVYHADVGLNRSQNAAVEATLRHPLVCLWGPPGTGKTKTIVAVIIALERILQKGRILVTAPTHNAVDNVMERYLKEASPNKESVLRVSTEVCESSPSNEAILT
ncbi:hypothetical protein GGS24DRAFT_168353 [Hypoxylon argillaceum]|nr:hypothetical protein GGS24DRAFT_168353 [Hypoxylon argillaceum]